MEKKVKEEKERARDEKKATEKDKSFELFKRERWECNQIGAERQREKARASRHLDKCRMNEMNRRCSSVNETKTKSKRGKISMRFSEK